MDQIQPIILAGGSGSRLWPVSREAFPKQLLHLIGKKTLLQLTLERVAGMVDVASPIIVVGEEHRYITKRQLDELKFFKSYEVLLEPLGKSTAPAICGAVEYVSRYRSPQAVILILPSDHVIDGEVSFYNGIAEAVTHARNNRIVTFGIEPSRSETGYGYIEKGEQNEVLSFKEKPELSLAEEYVGRANYYWNSGMLVFQADVFQKEMESHAPSMAAMMRNAIVNGRRDGDFFRFDAESMGNVENTSIDYVLMEKTEKAIVLPLDMGWRDIGSWYALWRELDKDDSGNVVRGDVILDNTINSLVSTDNRLVAALGLQNMLVAETGDGVLVATLSSAQDVKKIVEMIKKAGREEHRFHLTFSRPWGWFSVLEKRDRFAIRKVVVNAGESLSLQKHFHRDEHWVVVSGTARVTNGKDRFLLHEDQSTFISSGIIHRLENPGVIPLVVIEVQTGGYLGEDDIVAYEDKYGRV